MRPWTFPVALQAGTTREPVFQQIAQAIRRDIRRGRLRPGDALPGSRSLARTLAVHRNTVLAAYRELEAEGWTVAEHRTTRVARDLPKAPATRGPGGARALGYDLPIPAAPPSLREAGLLTFGGGQPDLRLVPVDLLARAYRRALARPELLGYGDARGEPRFRAALEPLLAREPLRAVYLTPHHQFPTTVTMGAARRLRLLELAARHRIALLEDDYDNEFHFEGRPVLPLAGEDPGGQVIYLGTLSKILAPGLRLGFVSGPRALVDALAARRAATDGQGDPVLQRAVSELLEDGLLQRHARKMRRTYQARREVLAAALRRHLGGAVAFDLPAGGMSLWLTVDPAVDTEAWAARARKAGLGITTGRAFDFRGRPRPHLRLGFSALDERELAEAVRRLASAL